MHGLQTAPPAPPPGPATAGALLARARRARRRSQLDLALEAGISTRHLSFVETGRARPSPGLVLRLCEALGVPPREADGVLLAAGHAPAHRETPLEAPAMAEVLAALRLILARHDPLPAVAFDAAWDIVMLNEAYGGALDALLAGGAEPGLGGAAPPRLALLPAPRPNLLRLLCHPAGARRLIGNWPEVARALIDRVQREARLPSADPARRPPLEEALAQPGVASLLRQRPAGPAAPLLVPVEMRRPEGGTQRFLTTIATLGTAQDLTLRELRIETYHPA
ncbi:helix-turn-helix transcriptional regulator [Roseicella frigidaeris]|uniref:Transcriptional regulator n=1 Tax=Roseicella frigidaeris TaxID=2230885 RepID=A0A327LZ81_9PROT|nr:helix-turn-helix transcriptional regulator [Roseicella frigidaeris]RAI55940.1 transcriptional regulator [Roseicella frigidaeris]